MYSRDEQMRSAPLQECTPETEQSTQPPSAGVANAAVEVHGLQGAVGQLHKVACDDGHSHRCSCGTPGGCSVPGGDPGHRWQQAPALALGEAVHGDDAPVPAQLRDGGTQDNVPPYRSRPPALQHQLCRGVTSAADMAGLAAMQPGTPCSRNNMPQGSTPLHGKESGAHLRSRARQPGGRGSELSAFAPHPRLC